ncbi:hypothetical protein DFH07DRAFT_774439 [Mycena maculata]|uniref:Uncharacterized protein n=1 Tax=Mycena maculata TaxID=230809 RepID=A0AAD7J0J9_9AGAR|nr:hypothetical protein DFH07DRAFT_774439 [Mycena maculata]
MWFFPDAIPPADIVTDALRPKMTERTMCLINYRTSNRLLPQHSCRDAGNFFSTTIPGIYYTVRNGECSVVLSLGLAKTFLKNLSSAYPALIAFSTWSVNTSGAPITSVRVRDSNTVGSSASVGFQICDFKIALFNAILKILYWKYFPLTHSSKHNAPFNEHDAANTLQLDSSTQIVSDVFATYEKWLYAHYYARVGSIPAISIYFVAVYTMYSIYPDMDFSTTNTMSEEACEQVIKFLPGKEWLVRMHTRDAAISCLSRTVDRSSERISLCSASKAPDQDPILSAELKASRTGNEGALRRAIWRRDVWCGDGVLMARCYRSLYTPNTFLIRGVGYPVGTLVKIGRSRTSCQQLRKSKSTVYILRDGRVVGCLSISFVDLVKGQRGNGCEHKLKDASRAAHVPDYVTQRDVGVEQGNFQCSMH